MRVETFICEYLELQTKLLPRLRGHVFHVTDESGFAGITQSGFIKVVAEIPPKSNTLTRTSFGRSRGYICLMDLRNASDEVIECTYGFYYFLDPFSHSSANIFFLLAESEYSRLIPNTIGVNARGLAAVPELEVWYPGSIPLSAIEHAIRVPMCRPDPYDIAMDRNAFAKLYPNG